MNLGELSFFLTEAWIGMRRSSLMIMLTIGTVILSLVIFGFFLLGTVNLQNLSHFLASNLEIRLFLKDGLTMPEISEFENRVLGMKEVQNVTFVHKDDAWNDFKENFHNLALEEGISQNPLPHTLMIKAKPNVPLGLLAEELKKYDTRVEQALYGGEIAERLEAFSHFTKVGGLVLVGLLGLSTLFIIMNTIRLTVIARQNEISIMKLVGATDNFVQGPFLIEGLLIGCVGAVFSIGILRFLYQLVVVKIQDSIPFVPLVFNQSDLWRIYAIIAITGALLGLIGAYISVSRSLKNLP